MTEDKSFKFTARLSSFRYAFRGVRVMLLTQHNAWVHLSFTVGVFIAAFLFQVSADEWCWLILAMMSVWTTEALNTALEFVCDVVSPEFHSGVEKAKDVAAASVLLSALGATAIGVIVFGPRIFGLM